MANIVITKSPVKIIIKYNSLAGKYKTGRKLINRRSLSLVSFKPSGTRLEITREDNDIFHLTYDDIDTIDGVEPSSIADAADKISDLML